MGHAVLGVRFPKPIRGSFGKVVDPVLGLTQCNLGLLTFGNVQVHSQDAEKVAVRVDHQIWVDQTMLPLPISSPDIDFLRFGLASLNHLPALRYSHLCIVRRKVILGGAADRLRCVDTVLLSVPSVAEDAATLNIFQINRYWLVVEKCPQLSLVFPSPRFTIPSV